MALVVYLGIGVIFVVVVALALAGLVGNNDVAGIWRGK